MILKFAVDVVERALYVSRIPLADVHSVTAVFFYYIEEPTPQVPWVRLTTRHERGSYAFSQSFESFCRGR